MTRGTRCLSSLATSFFSSTPKVGSPTSSPPAASGVGSASNLVSDMSGGAVPAIGLDDPGTHAHGSSVSPG